MREALKDGQPLDKAIQTGFDKSWTAIWDSHVTSLSSAVILYIFGISLIKGFGFMLGLGIVLSLFTSMWVSRALIIALAKCMGKNTLWFIGFKK
jgi:preprotein translocase subunit SecD